MYHGNNPTALQSRNWLITALIDLMQEMPYDKISVITICKKADLSRQTFYNLFNSKDDLLHFFLRQQCEEKFHEMIAHRTLSVEDMVAAFADVLQSNAPLLKLMIANHLEQIISEEIAACVILFGQHFSFQGRNDDTFPYGAAFLSGALAQILIFWFKQEHPVSLEELSGILLDIISGNYYIVND